MFGLITSGQIIHIRKRGQGKFSSDSFLGGIKDKENYLPPFTAGFGHLNPYSPISDMQQEAIRG